MNSQIQTCMQIQSLSQPRPSSLRLSHTFLFSAQRRPPRRQFTNTNSTSFRVRVSNCISSSSSSIRCVVTEESNEVEEEQKKKQVRRRVYPFHEIEPRWQRYWEDNRTFRTPDDDIDTSKPKFYVLDMFPYPRFPPSLSL